MDLVSISRRNWNSVDNPPSLEALQVGALLRIANALETLAADKQVEMHQTTLNAWQLEKAAKDRERAKEAELRRARRPEILNTAHGMMDLRAAGIRRCRWGFDHHKVKTLGDLACFSRAELRQLRGMGKQTLAHIEGTLFRFGLSLWEPPSPPGAP